MELLSVSLGAAGFFFYQYFCLMIIKYLSPIHLMFAIPPFYFIAKFIMLVYTALYHKCTKTESENKFDSNSIFIAKFCLDSIGDIFCFFSNLIYLEILELNFCDLNYNIRNNIIERSLLDFYGDNESEFFNEEDNEEESQKKDGSINEDINNISSSELSNK